MFTVHKNRKSPSIKEFNCNEIHNGAVKALRFPENFYKDRSEDTTKLPEDELPEEGDLEKEKGGKGKDKDKGGD